MSSLLVAVTNMSSVPDSEVMSAMPIIDDQNNLDVRPIWQVAETTRVFIPRGGMIPPQADRIEHILDNSDQAGALGYHSDGQQDKVPTSYIFALDSQKDGADWRVVWSHEAIEASADPFISYSVPLDVQIGGIKGGYSAILMLELADAAENDSDGYKRQGAKGLVIPLSNFVLPSWFSMPWQLRPGVKAGRFAFVDNVHAAFSLDRNGKPVGLNAGGYIGLRIDRISKDWSQVEAMHEPVLKCLADALPPGEAHILLADGTRLDPKTINPYSRRSRWLKKYGGQDVNAGNTAA